MGRVMNEKLTPIPFHRPCITEDEIFEVLDSLSFGCLTTGPKCVEFEKAFTNYTGCKLELAWKNWTET
jgi:dTDP-4-amino-4,6-dideoxygalactose transaminase